MERLTCKYDGINALRDLCVFNRGNNIEADSCISCDDCCDYHQENDCDGCPIQKAFDKLAEYENLEEQGLLLKLPCKVGDILYWIDSLKECCQCTVERIYIDNNLSDIQIEVSIDTIRTNFSSNKLNKTVILTKEEAEKKLKKIKEENK